MAVEEQRAVARKRSKRRLHKTGDKTLEWNAFKKTWDEETMDQFSFLDNRVRIQETEYDGPHKQHRQKFYSGA